jgi:hypothetical protein
MKPVVAAVFESGTRGISGTTGRTGVLAGGAVVRSTGALEDALGTTGVTVGARFAGAAEDVEGVGFWSGFTSVETPYLAIRAAFDIRGA